MFVSPLFRVSAVILLCSALSPLHPALSSSLQFLIPLLVSTHPSFASYSLPTSTIANSYSLQIRHHGLLRPGPIGYQHDPYSCGTLYQSFYNPPEHMLMAISGRCHLQGQLRSPRCPYGHGPCLPRPFQQVHELQPQEPRLG